MLQSVNETRNKTVDLIRRYAAWRSNDVENVLRPGAQGGPTALAVSLLAEQAGRLAAEARSLLAKPDISSSVTTEEYNDLVAIAEELELAAAEGSEASTPDVVFAGLSAEKKLHLVSRAPVDATRADRLRARMRGDIRQQTPPPATNHQPN